MMSTKIQHKDSKAQRILFLGFSLAFCFTPPQPLPAGRERLPNGLTPPLRLRGRGWGVGLSESPDFKSLRSLRLCGSIFHD